MYIVDFDDTLFNTAALKRARKDALAVFGINGDLYDDTYSEAYKNGGVWIYSNESHADVLELRGYDRKKIYEILSKTTDKNNLPSYLNEGALDCLETLKKTNQPLVLLSLGDPSFQELKTIGSGVHEYFDRTFMVNDTKQHVLEELFKSHKQNEAWFINDKIDETQELATHFPGMKIVLKKSERFDEELYRQSGLPYFFTLKEIAAYVTT